MPFISWADSGDNTFIKITKLDKLIFKNKKLFLIFLMKLKKLQQFLLFGEKEEPLSNVIHFMKIELVT